MSSGQIGGWVKDGFVRLGHLTSERTQARLRSALGYLEIGSLLDDLAGTDEVRRLRDRNHVFELAIRRIAGTQPLYLEFGVFEGSTLRWWSEHLHAPGAQLIGFDSFVGLPERWRPGFEAGAFETSGPPEIDGSRVSLVAGWFEDTLGDSSLPSTTSSSSTSTATCSRARRRFCGGPSRTWCPARCSTSTSSRSRPRAPGAAASSWPGPASRSFPSPWPAAAPTSCSRSWASWDSAPQPRSLSLVPPFRWHSGRWSSIGKIRTCFNSEFGRVF